MSYCLNPACPNPENLLDTELCQACGSKLLLRDRYRVMQELGKGGFGATFLAKDESLPGSPYCVIKQLRPAVSSPHVLQMARDLFRREAKTLGKIGNHPQVPRLLDYFEANQEFYLVQEFISGSTLQQEVKKNGPFTEAGVKQFLSEVLPMLQYIHSNQVIHRDIKPANLIRRTQDKKLVLIDFGAVKDKVNPTRANASEQTALTAYAIGTPGYAPPEQMAMRPVYASDIYALGVTCVYLLTGKSPKDLDYDPTSGEMLWDKHVQTSEHFAGVLHKMLDVSVRHRYQNAAEVLRALDMEPYLESLAQSMVTPVRPTRDDKATPSGDLSGNLFPSSPSARMAAAIRARQAKSSGMDSGSMSGGSMRRRGMRPTQTMTKVERSRPTPSSDNSAGSPKPKLSADEVLANYTKGKRDFTFHDLTALALPKASLSGANFHQAQLQRVNFQGANLFNADFGRAGLSQATLRNANLARAYFSHADLQGADLRGADLSYAYLSNANLRGANLCGADLTGAKVTDKQLSQARTNWATVHPSGKRGIW